MKLASIAIVVALAGAQARAQDGARSFDQGVSAYQSGDYAGARTAWLEALTAGEIDRAAVLYNLGNAAYREKKPLEAAAWYTASLREAPRSADAWRNLEFVRREAGLEPADRGDLRATAHRLVSALTLAESARVVLGMSGLLALALLWEALRGGRAAKWTSGGLAALLVLALVPWVYRLSRAGRDDVFIVQPEGAPLLSEPRATAAVIGRVSAAREVARIDQVPGWVRVRGSEGSVGWIASESCIALAIDTVPPGSP